jgi:hypothetical protein
MPVALWLTISATIFVVSIAYGVTKNGAGRY